MKFIHDSKIIIKIDLYPFSFVVQVLIFQIEVHLMMDNLIIGENMMMEPK
jgi:hypothetical protein